LQRNLLQAGELSNHHIELKAFEGNNELTLQFSTSAAERCLLFQLKLTMAKKHYRSTFQTGFILCLSTVRIMKELFKNLLSLSNCFSKFIFYFLTTIFFSSAASSQVVNYVINPSFEEIQTLPWHPFGHWVTGWSGIDTTKGAFLPKTLGAPFYNAPGDSFDFQYPRTGSNDIVFTFYCETCPTKGRGYPRNRLKKNLVATKVYCARYYVVNRNVSPLGIADYGILLAGPEIDTITQCRIPLPYLTPQITYTGGVIPDTLHWTAIAGTLVADGHEKYMVLGNFKSNAATQTAVINSSSLPQLYCDVYMDDVSLVEMELPAFAGRDTSILPGDSVFIGRESDVGLDYACQWYKLPNGTVPIDTIAGLWVKPIVKTTYVVRQQLWCSGVKWDTVTVYINNVGLIEQALDVGSISVYPNPTNSDLRIKVDAKARVVNFTVRNLLGQVLAAPTEKVAEDEYILKTDNLPNGTYFLEAGSDRIVTRRFTVSR
jgi:hypothetical protein